jgi:cell division septation protein DedD
MNSLIDDDDFDRDEGGDRELTLGSGAILGIFIGLVVLCGGFFGFGYKMGSHKSAPILAAEPAAPATDFSGFRPSTSNTSALKPNAGSSSAPSAIKASPEHSEEESPIPEPKPAVVAAVPAPTHATAAPPSHPPATVATQTGVAPPVSGFFVQIAAISPAHQGDAELLVAALKAKGYPTAARSVPQDKLLHIQVGPYGTKQAAEAIKQRLSADGYNNPIVK